MLINGRNINLTLLFVSLLGAFIWPASGSAATADALCANAQPITLDETVRGAGRSAGEPDCFRVETPAGGLLMLDVSVPGAAVAEPRLGVLQGCPGNETKGLSVIGRTAASLVVAGKAAVSFVACVGAQDPRLELGDYKLRTAFAETGKTEPIEADPDGLIGGGNCAAKTEPIEADPDGLMGAGRCAAKTEPIEADPDGLIGGGTCAAKTEPIEADPDGLIGGGNRTEPEYPEALCRSGEQDDHGELFPCATPLAGTRVAGEIRNPWGDDRDLFAFRLDAPQTVRLETSGELDTLGQLYDSSGQALAAADGGGRGENFRLVKTLGAGVYFVRVEGRRWEEGLYTLEVGAVGRSW